MRPPVLLAGFALLASLGGCSRHEDTGGVSADDQRALNDAAAMLDANTAVPAQPSDQGNSQ